jgi:peroxiredoxin
MTDGRWRLLLVGLTAALLAANIVIKPGYDRRLVHAFVAEYGAPATWHGRLADDFELPLRDGSRFHLADHVVREVVILNFFATWCGPCRAEMPELQRYVEQMAKESKPLRLLGIDAQESAGQVDQFVRELGLSFPVGIDEEGDVMRAYGVTGFPLTVVIGADGRIKLYQTGAIFNADVAFANVVAPEFAAIAVGRGTSAQAYLQAVEQQPPRPPASDANPADDATDSAALTGRGRSIAEAMPCPCGCTDRVVRCACQTAKGIQARLRQPLDPALSDGEVMQRLNKEFCMKGM